MLGLDKAQRNYDRQEPDYSDDEEEIEEISERDIEEFIAILAETGEVTNWAGTKLNLNKTVYYALANDFVFKRDELPGATYVAFWDWAERFVRDKKNFEY